MNAITLKEVASLLQGSQIIFICSPNFEYRSVVSATQWINDLRFLLPDLPAQMSQFRILTLQASGERVPPLENLKASFKTIVEIEARNLFGGVVRQLEVPYPEAGPTAEFRIKTQIGHSLKEINKASQRPVVLILDISTLPRRLLVTFYNAIRDWSAQRLITNVVLLYTWANKYPASPYATQVGGLTVLKEEIPLTEWLAEARQIDTRARAVVFLGRQGFDAKSFVDAVADFEQIDVFSFLNQKSLQHSLETYRANAPVLGLAGAKHRLHHFLTVEQGYSMLCQTLAETNDQGFNITVMAPFSAKPLFYFSLLAESTILQQSPEHKFAIVSLPSHHYGSVYSLGAGTTDAFHIELYP